MLELDRIYNMDCIEGMKQIPDSSIDSVLTDPPYELGFMGKSWDASGIAYNVELWRECLRVLRPGGHLLSFGGTRTYHRMAVAIEDAGFEVRDMLEWIYASGFPKSLNIGKAVDKIAPRLGQFDEFSKHLTEQIKASGKTQKEIASLFPSKTGGLTGCVWNWANGANVPTVTQWNILKPLLNLSDEFLPLIERIEAEREVIGKVKPFGRETAKYKGDAMTFYAQKKYDKTIENWNIITSPTTEQAKQWEGFGTALKPAHEPIIMARKPLSEKTIVENVLKHGTGGLDIDGCRIPTRDGDDAIEKGIKRAETPRANIKGGNLCTYKGTEIIPSGMTHLGRFPANIICTDDALNDGVIEKSGITVRRNGNNAKGIFPVKIQEGSKDSGFGDSGSKSRYFDIDVWAEKHGLLQFPKASKRERNEGCEGLEERNNMRVNAPRESEEEKTATQMKNHHPTVKPVHLMSWLIRLVSKEGDTVLDPFCGSGSTAIACHFEHVNFIGFEKETEYVNIANARLAYYQKQTKLDIL